MVKVFMQDIVAHGDPGFNNRPVKFATVAQSLSMVGLGGELAGQ